MYSKYIAYSSFWVWVTSLRASVRNMGKIWPMFPLVQSNRVTLKHRALDPNESPTEDMSKYFPSFNCPFGAIPNRCVDLMEKMLH